LRDDGAVSINRTAQDKCVGLGKLLVRADANVAMGTGHVMRCLALAQAWQDAGGHSTFAMAESSPSLDRRLRDEKLAVERLGADAGTAEDADRTVNIASREHTDWIVVDGYQFGSAYQSALKAAGFKVLFIDDYGHADQYSADLVLNQNVSAMASLYEKRGAQTRLLLGPRYCLLRREFNRWHDWRREITPVGHRVLVTMGGSDPDNFTEWAVEALNSIEDKKLEVTVVAGGGNRRSELLERLVAGASTRIQFRQDVSDMTEVMVWADLAVSAAGTTCWEMCRLGLPALLVDLADNQTRAARELHQRGCAIHLGSGKEVSAERLVQQVERLRNSAEDRRVMSLLGSELVDGEGARRMASILCGVRFRLRPAQKSDTRLLWEWANDSEVRAASFSPTPIAWETHVAWFDEKLHRAGSQILIAEDDAGTPIGQIRFDAWDEANSEIGVSVAKAWRGRGLAAAMIREAAELVSKPTSIGRLHAYVKPENMASAAAFEKSGFKRIGSEQVRGNSAIHFVYDAS
jgi:UDP-2,4-diacetamido-2,4,6-trideoxy-beta-L-altropyranose hydrolase